MNQFNSINGDHDDRQLDKLLSRESFDQSDRSRLDRLELYWLNVSRGRIRKQRVVAGAVLLSLLLLTIPYLRLRPEPRRVDLSDSKLTDSSKINPPADPAEGANHESDVKSDFETSPVFHQLVGTAGTRHFREQQRRQRKVVTGTDLTVLLSNRVASDSHLNRSELIQRLQTSFSDLEGALIRFLTSDGLSSAQQRLGLECLSSVSTPRSLPIMFRFYRQAELANFLAPVIANLVSAEQAFQFAVTANSPETFCAFASKLLRGDSHQLSLYLTLVEQSQTTQLALACISDMAEPPTSQLFQFLTSSNRRMRLMAALALGQIDDDAAVQHLMRMALELPTRFPAMVALTSSKNETAKQFVQYARFDIQFADSVQSAQSLLHSVSQNLTEKG